MLAIALGFVLVLVTLPPPAAGAHAGVGDLVVNDSTHQLDNGVSDVRLAVSADLDWSVPDATKRIVRLDARPAGASEYTAVAWDINESPGDGEVRTIDLEGSLLDLEAFNESDIVPEPGETTETDVEVRLYLGIDDADGERLEANATTTATLTLEHTGEAIHVDVGGHGDFVVVLD
ncbi:MAG: hypothetical protein ACOC42_00925 [Halobacteriota archaeon]